MNYSDDTEELKEIIQQIHLGSFQLCQEAVGRCLPTAGNIGIFCQSESDYIRFTKIKDQITEPSDNPDQKYFRLKRPIVVPSVSGIPETTYTYLYIRKPAADSPESGDIDFVLDPEEYKRLKQQVAHGKETKGAAVYDRPGWDTIELRNPSINALAYIGTQDMAEKARVKF